MGGKGGNRTSTTTQQATPWAAQQPYLRDVFQQAQNLYQQGGQQYYPGDLVAPFAPAQQQAFDLITNRALSGSPQQDVLGAWLTNSMGQNQPSLSPAYGAAGQSMGGVGASQNVLSGMAQNPYAAWSVPGASGYGDVLSAISGANGLGEAQQQLGALGTSAGQQLDATARGDFLGSNPYLDDVYSNAAENVTRSFNEEVMPGINATFGGAGRTGSGLHREAVTGAAGRATDALGELATNIYAPAYESERNRQMQAAGMGGDLYLGGQGQALNAATAGLGFGDAALGRSYGAASSLGNLGLGGVGAYGDLYGAQTRQGLGAAALMPQYQGMQYRDLDALLGVGGAQQQQGQAQIDANVARYMFNQNSPYQNLNAYANNIYGLPGGYGTTTQSETYPRGSALSGILGGASLGSSLAEAFPALGPWGLVGGAVLGGILS